VTTLADVKGGVVVAMGNGSTAATGDEITAGLVEWGAIGSGNVTWAASALGDTWIGSSSDTRTCLGEVGAERRPEFWSVARCSKARPRRWGCHALRPAGWREDDRCWWDAGRRLGRHHRVPRRRRRARGRPSRHPARPRPPRCAAIALAPRLRSSSSASDANPADVQHA